MTGSPRSRRGFLAAIGAPLWARGDPRLKGTFLQLSGYVAGWDAGKWREAFGYFKELGLREYILQWSAADDAEFPDAAGVIAAQVRAARGRLWVGLVHEQEFWRRIEGPDAELSTYLDGLAERSAALGAKLRRLPHVHGWYIPQEIDDVNWRTRERQAMLLRYLRRVAMKGRVGISGFRGARHPVEEFVALWRAVARRTPVKTLFLQDGVGTGKSTIAQAAELKSRMAASGMKVRPVVELFEQTSPAGAPFEARPAPVERIQRQLRAAGGDAVGFSVPEYMTPLGGPEAGRLFAAERDALRR